MSMVIDGTAGLTFNNATIQNSGGKVIQVVNATYSTQVSNSISTYADTGLTATITPLFSTSKILIIVDQVGLYKNTSDTRMAIILLRSGTNILTIETNGAYTASTATIGVGGVGASFLDSPATTSTITYKTQFSSQQNSAAVICQIGGATSTITLMEIAA